MSASTLTKSSSEPGRDRGPNLRPARAPGLRADAADGGRGGRALRALTAGAAMAALVAGCSNSTAPPVANNGESLPLLATHALTISEPSDLAIDDTGTMLWTVTNNPEKLYQLDLDGQVVKTLSYVGNNLEGVAYDRRDRTLWLAEENLREVVHVDLNGAVLGRYPLALTGEQNSGLEGICLNDSGTVFVLNEKHPGLFIRLKPDLSIDSMLELTFAKDYSGMTYDIHRKSFWIVSDQSEQLYRWTTSGVQEQYVLPFPKPEGVAEDPLRQRIYVVSDSTNALYVFDSSHAGASAHAQ